MELPLQTRNKVSFIIAEVAKYVFNPIPIRLRAMEEFLESKIGWTKEEKNNYRREHNEKESQYLRLRRVRTSLKEFTILSKLGKGGYGDVFLCRKIDTGEILALKRMKKSRFTDRNEVHRVKQEREVMAKSNSQWLAKLKYCFQSNDYLFMAMEYIAGGDIKNLLDHVECLPEDSAKFFFAEMLLSVDALHQLGYIHRDLKPDNFMIDKSGHLKLIDFGLSKEGFKKKFARSSLRELRRRESTAPARGWSTSISLKRSQSRNRQRTVYSVVGSPEYMAVEILTHQGYNHLVDYWSLGVILYEFIYGITPFGANTVKEVFHRVQNWKAYLHPPEYASDDEYPVSSEFWDLLMKLICDATDRFQSITEIQAHPWFKSFNWDKIREMDPPFIPELEDEVDTSYFQNDSDIDQSIDLLVSRQLDKNFKVNSISKVYSYKENLNDLVKSLELDEVESNQENPKLKFNQSCSKFEFAGFTFKHEDLNVVVDSTKSSPVSKKNSGKDDAVPGTQSVPNLKISIDKRDKKSKKTGSNSNSPFTSPRDAKDSPKEKSKISKLIQAVADLKPPKHLDRSSSVVIHDDSPKKTKKNHSKLLSLSKKRGSDSDSEPKLSPREASSDTDSVDESKKKKKNRPKKEVNERQPKFSSYRNSRRQKNFFDEDEGRQRSGTVDDAQKDEEFINIKKSAYKRRSEGRPRKKNEEVEDQNAYIEIIQKSIKRLNSKTPLTQFKEGIE